MLPEDKAAIRQRLRFMEALSRRMDMASGRATHNEQLVVRWYLEDVEALLNTLAARERSELLCKDMLLECGDGRSRPSRAAEAADLDAERAAEAVDELAQRTA